MFIAIGGLGILPSFCADHESAINIGLSKTLL